MIVPLIPLKKGDFKLSFVPPLLRGARACFQTSPPDSDPPKSPFLRGTLTLVPPFLRGARGDRRFVANRNEIGIRYTI